jgi:hypothetical protein
MDSLIQNHNGKLSARIGRPRTITPANADQTEQLLATSPKQGRPFEPGNTAAVGRKPLLTRGSLTAEQSEKADPRLRVHLKRGEQYRRVRMAELTKAHGYVSSGVGIIVATEARLHSFASYFLELGLEEGQQDFLVKSASFANNARTYSLSAWELCAREAETAAKLRSKSTMTSAFFEDKK